MAEIQNCLPEHTRKYFIQLRNLKWEELQTTYTSSLRELRNKAAANGSVKSGHHQKAEWDLTEKFHGNRAYAYYEAAIEACALYELKLDQTLCTCIATAVKDLLIAQQRNALKHRRESTWHSKDSP
jgi:hypothetical protein